jgi:hypothetical protein
VLACLHPELPQAVADAQRKSGVAQVVQQRTADGGDHVARWPVATAGIKAPGRLAEALIGRSEQVVVLEAMADRKAAGLLLRQAQVLAGKGALRSVERPAGS